MRRGGGCGGLSCLSRPGSPSSVQGLGCEGRGPARSSACIGCGDRKQLGSGGWLVCRGCVDRLGGGGREGGGGRQGRLGWLRLAAQVTVALVVPADDRHELVAFVAVFCANGG